MTTDGSFGALTIAQFCETFNVGRTFIYGQIKMGRLTALKAGGKTLISRDEAGRWIRELPKLENSTCK